MPVGNNFYKICNAKCCEENESKYTHRPFEPLIKIVKVPREVDAGYLLPNHGN